MAASPLRCPAEVRAMHSLCLPFAPTVTTEAGLDVLGLEVLPWGETRSFQGRGTEGFWGHVSQNTLLSSDATILSLW